MAKPMPLKTPYADLLPPLSTEEFEALKADIKAEGKVLQPVVVDEDGNILDGHHRYKVDKKAPTQTIKGLCEEEKIAYVFRSNFTRRNLSPTQKKAALADMKKAANALRDKDPKKWTQKRVAGIFGVARETVRNWFLPPPKRTGSKGRKANTSSTTEGSRPDAKVKVNPAQKPAIARRIASGAKRSQVAADYGVTERTISTIVKAETKTAEIRATREKAAKNRKTNNGVICGDFRVGASAIEDESIDLILTDPPYDKDSTGIYQDIAELARTKLAKGGWLLAYSGKAHLPAAIGALAETPGLEYAWTFCILHSGGDARFRKFKLQTGWKPVVAAYRPPLEVSWEWFKDVVTGGREKTDHPWQQAVDESAHFIQHLCPKKGVVLDPCCGSGTALLAAKQEGRQWLGYEINKEYAETARSRLDD